jgi:hypothetical protein
MSRDEWVPRDDDDWYLDQGSLWRRLIVRSTRRQKILAAVSASALIILVSSVLAFSLHAQPALTASLVGTGTSTPASTASALAPVPPGMPTHFSFGVMNSPGDTALLNDMRTHNGTAWDFRYQYLAGGVNTGKGWETWNSPAGAFVTSYLQESQANGYIPTLVYYELRQSTSTCTGCDDGSTDRTNLADPAVMAAYYGNWRLLMQKIGQFGKPVLVIVEPDLWGFLQESIVFGANSATAVAASVASSGDADAAGFANTAQGFAQALLHIRDRYAPNALLTLHVSDWATTTDIGSSTDASLNVQQVAATTVQFLLTAGLRGNPKGVSTWDLLSNDVSDRDSAQGAAWWDPKNQYFPNFARYLSFISAVAAGTNRRIVMWQVPEGNQYFDTMNDSPHHTQDNRPQYILGHILDFARAGVIAVLFGSGDAGATIEDAAGDGVTNLRPIASFECDYCNNHVSVYPDDDGGYLRTFVGAYYRAGPLSLTQPSTWQGMPTVTGAPTITPPPPGTCTGTPTAIIGQTHITPNPTHPGDRVTISAAITLSCTSRAALEFDVYDSQLRSILKMPDYGEAFAAGSTRVITLSGTLPTSIQPGLHQISIGVFDTKWTTQYGYVAADVKLQVV